MPRQRSSIFVLGWGWVKEECEVGPGSQGQNSQFLPLHEGVLGGKKCHKPLQEAGGSSLNRTIRKGPRMPWFGQSAGRHMPVPQARTPKKAPAVTMTLASVTIATSRACNRSWAGGHLLKA